MARFYQLKIASDDIFAHKLLGDGLMIRPLHGVVVAPCDGTISMIYPTKHAIRD